MAKMLVNWSHVNQRITQRIQPQHRARVQKILNEMSVMQAPPAAVGHHEWYVDVYDDHNKVVARIIARGITIRSVYSPDMPPSPGSSKYSLTALRKAGIPTTPQKEISLLQEVFQEAEAEWSGTNGEFYNESETNEEPIPPTLRSPGIPPPPPSTRREGRGQPSLPPAGDTEPPAGRMMPRQFQRFGSSPAAPLSRTGPRPSIRREYEMPLIEEIFMEAEDELNGELEQELYIGKWTKDGFVRANPRPIIVPEAEKLGAKGVPIIDENNRQVLKYLPKEAPPPPSKPRGKKHRG